MDLHQLRVFTSVFRNKSFSRASEELRLTQPTVSDHIKALEEELRCRLFDRLGRRILPTAEAEVLFTHACELLDRASAIKDALAQLKRDLSGDLVIGASTVPGTYLLPSLMASFQERYPSVTFQIVIADSRKIIERILSHDLLLGVVGARLEDARLDYRPFTDDELTVIASPRLVRDESVTFGQLLGYPFVMREEGSGTRREFEKIVEQKGGGIRGIRIAGVFGSNDAVKQAVKAGLGVSILSRLSVAEEIKFSTLKEIRIKNLRLLRSFHVVSHRRRSLPPAYSLLADHILASARPEVRHDRTGPLEKGQCPVK